jgi:hypothetical protein
LCKVIYIGFGFSGKEAEAGIPPGTPKKRDAMQSAKARSDHERAMNSNALT